VEKHTPALERTNSDCIDPSSPCRSSCQDTASRLPCSKYQKNKPHQNTISLKIVKIHYPFHPLYGLELEVLSRSKSGYKEGTIKIKAPNGFYKEVPIWMTEPQSNFFCISKIAAISLKAIMNVIKLLECSMEDLKI
jgi:hypothetical protein